MRDGTKDGQLFWTDDLGRTWKTPTIRGRLKTRIPSHRALIQFVLRRDGKCMHCGATADLVADHIVSRRNGGAHHPDNLQALCQRCNSIKANTIDRLGS